MFNLSHNHLSDMPSTIGNISGLYSLDINFKQFERKVVVVAAGEVDTVAERCP